MASDEAHSAWAQDLLGQTRRSQNGAAECLDSYPLADAEDSIENFLVGNLLDKSVLKANRHLFHFRRGALYGCGVPSDDRLAEYCQAVERCFPEIAAKLEARADESAA